MSSSIVTRRQTWLRSSGLFPDVQATLLDLPFDGSKLFGEKADSALQRFKDSKATAKSLGLQTQSRGFGYRRNQGFGRSYFHSLRQPQQQQQNPLYKSYRGKGRGRLRGASRQLSSSSSTSPTPPGNAGKQP